MIGPIVVLLCLLIFFVTTIFFFLGMSGKLVLGGTPRLHGRIMELLMKVLVIEIIASCTLYFAVYMQDQYKSGPEVTFVKGKIQAENNELIIDLQRFSPIALSRVKYVIELSSKQDKSQYAAYQIEYEKQVERFKSEPEQFNFIAPIPPTKRRFDSSYIMSFVDSVTYKETGRSVRLKLNSEFDLNLTTDLINKLYQLELALPQDEYKDEFAYFVLAKLRTDNRLRILREQDGRITIGNLLALNFDWIAANYLRQELEILRLDRRNFIAQPGGVDFEQIDVPLLNNKNE